MLFQIQEPFILTKAIAIKMLKPATAKRGLHLAAIKKNNVISKNKNLNKRYCKLRSSYERVFSKTNHLVQYLGIAKN
jgi:hypothetical protein